MINLTEKTARALGYGCYRFRTGGGMTFRDVFTLEELDGGYIPEKDIIEFERGNKMDFRILYGYLLRDDGSLSHFIKSFCKPEYVITKLSADERAWLTKLKQCVAVTQEMTGKPVGHDDMIKIYHTILREEQKNG